MKGLKPEPGCRQACVTWLNLFLLKSKPPTSAWMAPSRGSSATKAPSTSGSCVISQVFFGVFATRITAPRRILILGGALSDRPDWAGSQALADDLQRVAVLAHGDDLLRAGLQHHGGHARRRCRGARPARRRSRRPLLGVGRQVDELLGPAVDLAPLVVHDALAQRLVGGVLLGGLDRREDVQAAGVGLVAILGIDQLAHGFGDVFGVDAGVVGAAADLAVPASWPPRPPAAVMKPFSSMRSMM